MSNLAARGSVGRTSTSIAFNKPGRIHPALLNTLFDSGVGQDARRGCRLLRSHRMCCTDSTTCTSISFMPALTSGSQFLSLTRAAFRKEIRAQTVRELTDVRKIVAQDGVGLGQRFRAEDSTGFRAWVASDDSRLTRAHKDAWSHRYDDLRTATSCRALRRTLTFAFPVVRLPSTGT
jgi:hypothetical protein